MRSEEEEVGWVPLTVLPSHHTMLLCYDGFKMIHTSLHFTNFSVNNKDVFKWYHVMGKQPLFIQCHLYYKNISRKYHFRHFTLI